MTSGRIADHVLQEIRDRADLPGLIGRHVQLKKVGADLYGKCPFCDDHSRHLCVVVKKQFWVCYICGAAGDAIRFLMLRGTPFREAAAEVAATVGVDIESNGGPPPGYDPEIEARKREQAENAHRERQEAKWAEVAEKLAQRFEQAEPAHTDHPYLVAKGITSAPGLKQEGDTLLVPMRASETAESLLMSIQEIAPDGSKRFAAGARAGRTRTVIGAESFRKRLEAGAHPILYICEGWATGWTINHVTGDAAVVAFSAANLKAVAVATAERYPDANIVIAADNDRWTKTLRGHNPGVLHARAAANAANATTNANVSCAIPDFKEIPAGEKLTDFNDLWRAEGEEAVLRWLDPTNAPMAQIVSEDVPEVEPDDDESDSRTGPGTAAPISDNNGAKTRSDPLILDPGAPLATARRLIADHYEFDGQRIIHCWRGDIRVYSGTHYPVLEGDAIRARVYAYLEAAHRPSKEGQLEPL